ncbi:MAG: hypothetical protein J6L72_05285, partial [Butyricicoccus sp.]|nr:hypothetical protein [Butyricicoccus sp.]
RRHTRNNLQRYAEQHERNRRRRAEKAILSTILKKRSALLINFSLFKVLNLLFGKEMKAGGCPGLLG